MTRGRGGSGAEVSVNPSGETMTLNDEPLIGPFFTKKSHLFADQG